MSRREKDTVPAKGEGEGEDKYGDELQLVPFQPFLLKSGKPIPTYRESETAHFSAALHTLHGESTSIVYGRWKDGEKRPITTRGQRDSRRIAHEDNRVSEEDFEVFKSSVKPLLLALRDECARLGAISVTLSFDRIERANGGPREPRDGEDDGWEV